MHLNGSKKLALIGLFAWSFVWLPEADAGPWTQKKDGFYIKWAPAFFFTRTEFDHNGDRVAIFREREGFDNASFQELSLTLYAEYGFTDRLTLIGNLPYRHLTSAWDRFIEFDPGDGTIVRANVPAEPKVFGFSDLTLSARCLIFPDPIVVSIQTGFKIPLGYREQPRNDGAPLGTGNADFEAHLLIGRSLAPYPVYVSSGIGFRIRTGPLHNEVIYNAEAGYRLNRFLFRLGVDGIRNVRKPPDLAGNIVVTPLPGGGGVAPSVIVGDQHITKINPSIGLEFQPGRTVQLEAFHTIAGRNTTSGTVLALGLVFER